MYFHLGQTIAIHFKPDSSVQFTYFVASALLSHLTKGSHLCSNALSNMLSLHSFLILMNIFVFTAYLLFFRTLFAYCCNEPSTVPSSLASLHITSTGYKDHTWLLVHLHFYLLVCLDSVGLFSTDLQFYFGCLSAATEPSCCSLPFLLVLHIVACNSTFF